MLDRPKNCSDLWLKFHSSFAYKDHCDFDINSYDEFLHAAQHNITTFNRVRACACLSFSMNLDVLRSVVALVDLTDWPELEVEK